MSTSLAARARNMLQQNGPPGAGDQNTNPHHACRVSRYGCVAASPEKPCRRALEPSIVPQQGCRRPLASSKASPKARCQQRTNAQSINDDMCDDFCLATTRASSCSDLNAKSGPARTKQVDRCDATFGGSDDVPKLCADSKTTDDMHQIDAVHPQSSNTSESISTLLPDPDLCESTDSALSRSQALLTHLLSLNLYDEEERPQNVVHDCEIESIADTLSESPDGMQKMVEIPVGVLRMMSEMWKQYRESADVKPGRALSPRCRSSSASVISSATPVASTCPSTSCGSPPLSPPQGYKTLSSSSSGSLNSCNASFDAPPSVREATHIVDQLRNAITSIVSAAAKGHSQHADVETCSHLLDELKQALNCGGPEISCASHAFLRELLQTLSKYEHRKSLDFASDAFSMHTPFSPRSSSLPATPCVRARAVPMPASPAEISFNGHSTTNQTRGASMPTAPPPRMTSVVSTFPPSRSVASISAPGTICRMKSGPHRDAVEISTAVRPPLVVSPRALTVFRPLPCDTTVTISQTVTVATSVSTTQVRRH